MTAGTHTSPQTRPQGKVPPPGGVRLFPVNDDRLHWVNRWLYGGKRPGVIARLLNRFWSLQYAAGRMSRGRDMTLEVRGRRTGRLISLPVVVADYGGQRYLVSMLGENANWVRNVRAVNGRAVLRRRGIERVRLEEVPPPDRAPILRSYLGVAPGARPHFPVDQRAPSTEYERIANAYPVFRIVSAPHSSAPPPGGPHNTPGAGCHARTARTMDWGDGLRAWQFQRDDGEMTSAGSDLVGRVVDDMKAPAWSPMAARWSC